MNHILKETNVCKKNHVIRINNHHSMPTSLGVQVSPLLGKQPKIRNEIHINGIVITIIIVIVIVIIMTLVIVIIIIVIVIIMTLVIIIIIIVNLMTIVIIIIILSSSPGTYLDGWGRQRPSCEREALDLQPTGKC